MNISRGCTELEQKEAIVSDTKCCLCGVNGRWNKGKTTGLTVRVYVTEIKSENVKTKETESFAHFKC